MRLNEKHKKYLRELSEMPKDVPEWWDTTMAELHAAGYIQRIGKSIYLTEKGQDVVARI